MFTQVPRRRRPELLVSYLDGIGYFRLVDYICLPNKLPEILGG